MPPAASPANLFGNGLETRKAYDEATGQLMGITSAFGAADPIRSLIYQYDSLNNVTSRVDHVQGMSESFTYDRQDRLTQSHVTGQIGDIAYNNTVDYSYDAMGNILNKSDVGNYSYGDQNRTVGNAGPHALLSAGANHTGYQYDANGNLLQGGGRTLEWSSFNKPTLMSKSGTSSVLFQYGPDRARYLKVTETARTLYIGKAYERIESGTKLEHKHFIYADGQLVAIHVKTSDNGTAQADKTRYLHRDSLGSIDTITDGQGNIVDRMSYEPFGQRRAGDWRVGTGLPIIPALTNRGFTGHEHVDGMGLIHMNGRVYDPQLGRFLSADPTMQFPYSSQGYNRYAYVQNNPLKYTDPSGYGLFSKIFKSIKRFVKKYARVIVAIAVAAIVGPMVAKFVGQAMFSSIIVTGGYAGVVAAGSTIAFASAIAGAAAAGFVAGGIMSGSFKGALKGAVFGALSGGLAYGVGHGFGLPDNAFIKAVAHGVSQGAVGSARGGKFKDSFIGAFIGHAVGGPLKSMIRGGTRAAVVGRTVVAAISGGAGTALGGGKFANGAVSAAFTHLFNAESIITITRSTEIRKLEGQFAEFKTAGEWGDTYADDLAGAVLTLAGGVPRSAQQAFETLLPSPSQDTGLQYRTAIYWRVPVVDKIPESVLYIDSEYIGPYRTGGPVKGLDWNRAKAFAIEGEIRVCGSFTGCSREYSIPGSAGFFE